jgi:hypothetical protein
MSVVKSSALAGVLGAVAAALRGDAQLQTVLGGAGRVHVSNPPSELSPPYVYIPDVTSIPQRVIGGLPAYHDGTFTVEVHDDGTSPLTALTAAERVAVVLDGVALAVTGFTTVFVHMAQERRDPLVPGQERATIPFTFKVRRTAS